MGVIPKVASCRPFLKAVGLAIVLLAQAPGIALAIESATQIYLLGAKTSLAGVTPPPGVYLQDFKYYYSGSNGGGLDQSGIIAVGLDAKAYYDMPTLLWVPSIKVLDGRVGFGIIVPIGWKDVSVNAELNLPPPLGIAIQRNFSDSNAHYGDPIGTALIGWDSGNWHWNLQALLNVPVGFWERRNLTNTGFNRWAVDTTAAVTWLDAKAGWEVSTAVGFTFNSENPDTDYKSGTEFHVEGAIVRNFSKDFGIGIAGYHYQQVTGDSGEGARLGEFKGRVSGIGPVINYNFMLGKIPVNTSWKYFHELDVKNRLEGDAGLVTITLPLWTPPK